MPCSLCGNGACPHAVNHPPLLVSSVDNFFAAEQAALFRVNSIDLCSFTPSLSLTCYYHIIGHETCRRSTDQREVINQKIKIYE